MDTFQKDLLMVQGQQHHLRRFIRARTNGRNGKRSKSVIQPLKVGRTRPRRDDWRDPRSIPAIQGTNMGISCATRELTPWTLERLSRGDDYDIQSPTCHSPLHHHAV